MDNGPDYLAVIEEQAAKIRFLMMRIAEEKPHKEIAAEFVSRCLSDENFEGF